MAPDPPPGPSRVPSTPAGPGPRLPAGGPAERGLGTGSDGAARPGPSWVGRGECARGDGQSAPAPPRSPARTLALTPTPTPSRSRRRLGGLLRPRRRSARPGKPLAARGGEGWAGAGGSRLLGVQLFCCPGRDVGVGAATAGSYCPGPSDAAAAVLSPGTHKRWAVPPPPLVRAPSHPELSLAGRRAARPILHIPQLEHIPGSPPTVPTGSGQGSEVWCWDNGSPCSVTTCEAVRASVC